MYGGFTTWPDSHDVKGGIRVIFIVRSALSSCQKLDRGEEEFCLASVRTKLRGE